MGQNSLRVSSLSGESASQQVLIVILAKKQEEISQHVGGNSLFEYGVYMSTVVLVGMNAGP
jgi:hypothetical protein